MKKILLAALVLGSAMCGYAEESYAPEAGQFSTEIQFTPFKSNGESFNMTALSGRYFLTNKDALVVELGLGGTNKKTVSDTANADAFESNYKGTFSLTLGYQRHFYQYKRVDLYAGAKVGYVHEFAGHKSQYDKNNWAWNNSGTGNGFHAYLTTGIDFYVYKGLFLGAEINLGFEDVVATNTTHNTCVDGVKATEKTSIGGHDFSGGFNVQPTLRLGWSF